MKEDDMEKISFIFCIVFLVTGLAHAATFDASDETISSLKQKAREANPNDLVK